MKPTPIHFLSWLSKDNTVPSLNSGGRKTTELRCLSIPVMKRWDFALQQRNLFSGVSLPRVSWGPACCSASDGWISEGSMIPLIASLKPFVRTEWWWSGSIRAVMKPRGAAEGQDLRETKGNIQLLQSSWMPVGVWPCEWLTMFGSGCLRWALALKQIPLKSAHSVLLCPQFVFVYLYSGGWLFFFFFLCYYASFPCVLWLSCGHGGC